MCFNFRRHGQSVWDLTGMAKELFRSSGHGKRVIWTYREWQKSFGSSGHGKMALGLLQNYVAIAKKCHQIHPLTKNRNLPTSRW